MPKLRANPSLTGGQIRLRSSRRVADFKWLGVIAVLLAATAFEGLPMAQFGRAAVEFVSRDVTTVAVASEARLVDPSAGLVVKATNVDRGESAMSRLIGRGRTSADGPLERAPLKVEFCRWLKPDSHS